MQPLLERIGQRRTLVGDGAIGTMLMDRGLGPGECPESVNLARPQCLEEIARAYLEAGAEIVQTNTFGASPLKLALHGLEQETAEINESAVHAVRRVVGQRAYVSASCGPSGRLLQPYGDAAPDEVYQSFRRQMQCLIGAGVDCVCVETMVDLAEAILAVKAAKDVAAGTLVMATMTFDSTSRGFYTVMGVNIEKAAAGLQEAGADIIGSNCGNGIENMIKIAAGFRECSDLPLIIQSNAGLPQITDGMPCYSESPEFMADKAQELIRTGVSIIGGCCGTTPEHIRAIRQVVDSSVTK
jgi:5-methyltetrahydrofolate--homocysteine methyltransferase